MTTATKYADTRADTRADTHNDVVLEQYDSAAKASAYLTSAVHASGADLDAMAAIVGPRPDAIALDMGCGGGHVTFRLAPLVGKVVACDLSAAMLDTVATQAQARDLANVVTARGAAEALPFADASFDIVATRYSAHHWEDFGAGIAQMRRVLKPGGLALFADVVTPEAPLLDTWLQTMELLRDPSHVRDMAVSEWEEELASRGFAVEAVTRYRVRLDFGPWIERMRTPDAHVAAIRSLQARAAGTVREYFGIEEEGSFTVDSALIVARAV